MNYLKFFLKNFQGQGEVIKMAYDKEQQQKMIYRTHVREYDLYYNRKDKLVTDIQYQELLNNILGYVKNITHPKEVKGDLRELYNQFDIKKEHYIKKLEALLETVKTRSEYGQELPSVCTAHTTMFRFAKCKILKWEPPPNGEGLMKLITDLYGCKL